MTSLEFAELKTVYPKTDFNKEKNKYWEENLVVPKQKVGIFSKINFSIMSITTNISHFFINIYKFIF